MGRTCSVLWLGLGLVQHLVEGATLRVLHDQQDEVGGGGPVEPDDVGMVDPRQLAPLHVELRLLKVRLKVLDRHLPGETASVRCPARSGAYLAPSGVCHTALYTVPKLPFPSSSPRCMSSNLGLG